MKKLLLAVAIIAMSSSVKAQKTDGKSGGTGLEIAGNVGTGTKTGYKTTYGGDIQISFPAATGLKITGSAGYQSFKFESGPSSHDFGYIPLFAGALVNLTSKLLAHGQLGYAISTESGGDGHFAFAPSIGYLLSQNLFLALRYMSIGEINAVMLRLALSLGKK